MVRGLGVIKAVAKIEILDERLLEDVTGGSPKKLCDSTYTGSFWEWLKKIEKELGDIIHNGF